MESKSPIIKPIGLITSRGRFGEYADGALSRADWCVMRDPGVLTPMPFPHDNGRPGTSGSTIRAGIALDAGHVYSVAEGSSGANNWQLWETLGTTVNQVTLPSAIGSTAGSFKRNRVHPVRSNGRMLINSEFGVVAGDSMAPTTAAERSVRWAGLPQPTILVSQSSTSPGTGTIPAEYGVGYRACLARKLDSGQIIRSMPSPPWKASAYNNLGDDTNPRIYAAFYGDVREGDVLEIYRTDGIEISTDRWDPGLTFKLVIEYVLTATDAANEYTGFITDGTRLLEPYYSTYGRELYTNPYQEGEFAANNQPSGCRCQAVFKDYVFWGNIREKPLAEIGFRGANGPSSLGGTPLTTPEERTYGIGKRRGACTATTIGNDTITGIAAADLVGVVVGQRWDATLSGFPSGSTVVAVGASSIQMSANATASVTGWGTVDVLDINGATLYAYSNAELLFGLGGYGFFEVTTNVTLNSADPLNEPGLRITVATAQPNSGIIELKATNGGNYSPPLAEIDAVTGTTYDFTDRTNSLRWSKSGEPEHAPSSNETLVGSGEIITMCATKNALWIACTDGIRRLSGEAGSWVIEDVDPKCIVQSPRGMCVMGEMVFAQTNYGFVVIDDSGVRRISDEVISNLMPSYGYSEDSGVWVAGYDVVQEVVIALAERHTSSPNNSLYVYNTEQRCFTNQPDWGNVGWTAFTAGFYQDTPADGPPSLIVGTTSPSAAPGLRRCRHDIGSSSDFRFPAAVVYQPLRLEAPEVRKQHIDVTMLFGASFDTLAFDALLAVGNLPASVVASAVATQRQVDGDLALQWGVPAEGSLAFTLSPGFRRTNGATWVEYYAFYGLSVRYVPLSLQPAKV